jgi:hypothetical protein
VENGGQTLRPRKDVKVFVVEGREFLCISNWLALKAELQVPLEVTPLLREWPGSHLLYTSRYSVLVERLELLNNWLWQTLRRARQVPRPSDAGVEQRWWNTHGKSMLTIWCQDDGLVGRELLVLLVVTPPGSGTIWASDGPTEGSQEHIEQTSINRASDRSQSIPVRASRHSKTRVVTLSLLRGG